MNIWLNYLQNVETIKFYKERDNLYENYVECLQDLLNY